MADLLSNFVNNFYKATHKIKCKYGHDHKKHETCGIKCKGCDCFVEYIKIKDELIELKCICSNKIYQKSLMKT